MSTQRILRTMLPMLAVVAALAVTAGGLPLAASASAISTARSTAVGGDRAESDDDEAEEYLGLFLTKARAYEAFLTRESERADRTGGGVVVVPAEPAPAPEADPTGWPVWSLGLAAVIGLLVGAALTALSGRVRRPAGSRLTAA